VGVFLYEMLVGKYNTEGMWLVVSGCLSVWNVGW
jgi:hypothetical protein